MIDARIKSNVGKETEVIGVTINKLNEFLCISTKVDIVVELIRHGTLMSDDILLILNSESSLAKETTFETFASIPAYKYEYFVGLEMRVNVLLDMLENNNYVSTDEILRTLGTELAIEEADKIAREMEKMRERFNNK